MRADIYELSVTEDKLFIIDLDQGNMSVTNDAEAVVNHCHKEHPGKRVIYRDSDDDWCELTHNNGDFLGFAIYTGEVPV